MGKARGRPKKLPSEVAARNRMESRERWRKKNTKEITIRLNLESDKEVLEKLDAQPNKTDYIRRLIIEDIKSQ